MEHSPLQQGAGVDRRTVIGGIAVAGLGLTPAAVFAAPRLAGMHQPAVARLTHSRLEAAITGALGASASNVGLTVIDRRTGVRHSHQGDFQIQMASTSKVLILITFLRRRRQQGRALTAYDRSLVRSMIRYSDNNAATALFNAGGGASGMSAMASRLGMPATARSVAARRAWGASYTTSNEQARMLSILADGGRGIIPRSDCSYILSEMRSVTASQAWGAGVVRSRTVSVAVKNGWCPYRPDYRWRVNTLGVTRGDGRDYVIACYEHRLSSMQRGVDHKNAVIRAVHSALAARLS